MWFLLTSTVRRWAIASVLIPVGAKALGGVARQIERREGPTKLSKTLRSASSLVVGSGAQPARERSPLRRLLHR